MIYLISKTDEENGEESLINYLEDEIKLTQESLKANPKSYGSWHHRYWILLNHPKPNWQNEFNLLNKYFSMDDRNCMFLNLLNLLDAN